MTEKTTTFFWSLSIMRVNILFVFLPEMFSFQDACTVPAAKSLHAIFYSLSADYISSCSNSNAFGYRSGCMRFKFWAVKLNTVMPTARHGCKTRQKFLCNDVEMGLVNSSHASAWKSEFSKRLYIYLNCFKNYIVLIVIKWSYLKCRVEIRDIRIKCSKTLSNAVDIWASVCNNHLDFWLFDVRSK